VLRKAWGFNVTPLYLPYPNGRRNWTSPSPPPAFAQGFGTAGLRGTTITRFWSIFAPILAFPHKRKVLFGWNLALLCLRKFVIIAAMPTQRQNIMNMLSMDIYASGAVRWTAHVHQGDPCPPAPYSEECKTPCQIYYWTRTMPELRLCIQGQDKAAFPRQVPQMQESHIQEPAYRIEWRQRMTDDRDLKSEVRSVKAEGEKTRS